ncbi:Quinoprotein alcohol dehydrogenase-like protein [Gracilaria domingensis]|nr:Quinoprotein alcohol dehydrogenase-like protein [Gracilaria domingensis]
MGNLDGVNESSDGLLYAVGTTKGNFSFPTEEVPTLDAVVVVYNATNGELVRQAQYDVGNGLDDIAKAVVESSRGNLLLSVQGTPHNIRNSAVHETRLLEISRDTLALIHTHKLELTTHDRLISITGGPSISDIVYVRDQEAIVAAGQFLGRGVLFLYSLTTGTVLRQTEWGSILGNQQVGALIMDETGAFYVTGSSDMNVLDNGDLKNNETKHYHAYVIRYDNLLDGAPVRSWVRQLSGYGSSQSGDDIGLDPVTGELVVIGSFGGNFTMSDKQSGRTYELNTLTNNGLTDIFVWYIDAGSGSFKDLGLSSAASTLSEDRVNALQVLSSRRLEIGGVINDGADDEALSCLGE